LGSAGVSPFAAGDDALSLLPAGAALDLAGASSVIGIKSSVEGPASGGGDCWQPEVIIVAAMPSMNAAAKVANV
jgi:hypothetical protein